MTPAELGRLRDLSSLVLESRLAALRSAALALAQTEAKLNALEAPAAQGLDPITGGLVAARHAVWAGARRAALMPVLSDSLTQHDAARKAAAVALGRVRVLDGLGPKVPRP